MDEKNSESRELKGIIETYDGDPDEQVFFQTVQDFEEKAKQKQAEAIWGEVAFEENADFSKTEVVSREKSDNVEKDCDSESVKAEAGFVQSVEGMQTAETMQTFGVLREAEGMQTTDVGNGGTIPVNAGINPNDPHYIYYEPDPYYEYGYGTEPEPVGMSENGKDDGSGLGMTSMITGICSLVLSCCGLTYLLSLIAIITGICCLNRKQKTGSAKTFSIIGIICGALALLAKIFAIVLTYCLSFLTYFAVV